MADLLDYLHWRGDLSFSRDGLNEIDALIFSALAYIDFGHSMETNSEIPIPLEQGIVDVLARADKARLVRTKDDLQLLEALLHAPRFRNLRLGQYRNILIAQLDTQFAAMTFLLDDGSLFLAFRGTDYSIAGWKEDFNMSFQFTVPAQRLALAYTQEVAALYPGDLWLGGHSKGGNLAVFSAIGCEPEIRDRILGVFNHDGPGFREHILQISGYRQILPRLHTLVPQSSVVGLLLEHEEPYTIVKSKSLGIFQHELYTWELDGPKFVLAEDLTADSRFLNKTIRNWLGNMTLSDRNDAVEAIFQLLTKADVTDVHDLLKPQNIVSYFKTMSQNDGLRRRLGAEFLALIDAARKTIAESNGPGE